MNWYMKLTNNHRDYYNSPLKKFPTVTIIFTNAAWEQLHVVDILLHCWHGDCCLCMGNILFAPHLRHRFQLSVKVDSLSKLNNWGKVTFFLKCNPASYLFAVEIGITTERSTWASKGKHRERNRNRHVNSNLSQKTKNKIKNLSY